MEPGRRAVVSYNTLQAIREIIPASRRRAEGENPEFDLPVIALLARKTLQVVDVASCSHHHLERGDNFTTGRTIASVSEKS